MAPPLPTGQYIIRNDVNGDPVGNQGFNPPIQPVIRLKDTEVWTVTYLGGTLDQYLLDLHNFKTLPQGSHVESNRTGVQGTRWIITRYKARDELYTIIDSRSGRERLGWTLHPGAGSPVVALEPVPRDNIKPQQLWRFQHIVFNSEEGEDEDEDEDEDEEGEEEN